MGSLQKLHDRVLLIISLFLFQFILLSEGQSSRVPAAYFFGDSLIDVGNNNYLKLSLLKADFPHNGIDFPGHKATGRFSNGKNSADFIAEKLGLPTPPPYLANRTGDFLKGVNFASGGAGILNTTDSGLITKAIPMWLQLDYFATVLQRMVKNMGADGTQQHLSKSLFPIVIGSNDMFAYFKPKSTLAKSSSPQQYLDLMISTLQAQLTRLHSLGARKFVVIGLGAIGCCPAQRVQNEAGECNPDANTWARKYNGQLKTMLQELKTGLGDIKYSYFDIYNVFMDFTQKPANYGFTEIKSACCGLGDLRANIPCTPLSEYCANRTNYLFWDLYHPTEAAAHKVVDTIFGGSKEYATPMTLDQLVAA